MCLLNLFKPKVQKLPFLHALNEGVDFKNMLPEIKYKNTHLFTRKHAGLGPSLE